MTICLGKSIWFTVRVFLEHLSIFVYACFFPFDFESGIWNLIVLIPTIAYLYTLLLFRPDIANRKLASVNCRKAFLSA